MRSCHGVNSMGMGSDFRQSGLTSATHGVNANEGQLAHRHQGVTARRALVPRVLLLPLTLTPPLASVRVFSSIVRRLATVRTDAHHAVHRRLALHENPHR